MDNERMVKKWQAAIIRVCRDRLGRVLTPQENKFITSRGGFIALEMIEDTVRSLPAAKLEKYLNSEPQI